MASSQQEDLRRKVLDYVREYGTVQYPHTANYQVELGARIGVSASKTQMDRAIGWLNAHGAVRLTHPQIHVVGVLTKVHQLRFVKDVEIT